MRRILLVLVSGALAVSVLGAAPGGFVGTASAARNFWSNGFSVWINPIYRIPNASKVEFFYVHGSGQCFQGLRPDQVTWIQYTDPYRRDNSHELFRTYRSDPTESCTYMRTFGTWQVRVTTPTDRSLPPSVVRTGSLYITTSSWVGADDEVDVSCRDFSNMTCTGSHGSPDKQTAKVALDVTLGPITGTQQPPRLPFGSS